jgi:hypothetical protein
MNVSPRCIWPEREKRVIEESPSWILIFTGSIRFMLLDMIGEGKVRVRTVMRVTPIADNTVTVTGKDNKSNETKSNTAVLGWA